MDAQAATRIQNTLLNNRVKILKLCDYYTVSAPLISKRIMPMEKHKEIKSLTLNIQEPKAANTARMDALLDFIDEVPSLAFDTFLEGVRNCEASKQFAKVLKKEVEGGNGGVKLPPKGPTAPRPKVSIARGRNATTALIPVPSPTQLQGSAAGPVQVNSVGGGGATSAANGPTALPISFSFPGPGLSTAAHAQMLQNLGTEVSRPIKKVLGSAAANKKAGKAAAPKPLKAKAKKDTNTNGPTLSSDTSAPNSDIFDFNTDPNVNPFQPAPKVGRTPRPSKKLLLSKPASTPGTPNNKDKTTPTVKKEKKAKPVIKRVYPAKVKSKTPVKALTPGPSLTATLVYKNKEKESTPTSASPALEIKAETPKVKVETPKVKVETPKVKADGSRTFSTSVPVGSPFRPKNGVSNAAQNIKPMTFQEAEEKQRTANLRFTGFTFTNENAVVMRIHYSNKSDLFYEGCPTKEGNYLCTRKVQLKGKGKKYVCKQKHENEAYELFPRLIVTFDDGTGQLEATLYRENAEILSGKSVTEMHVMNDAALSAEFAKAIGFNIPIRVNAEKILKKDLKTSGGRTWNNVAHIMSDSASGPPPTKKAKKAE